MNRTFATVAIGLVLAAASVPHAQQSGRDAAVADRGMLAVVRRDGLLIPFAAFRGSHWSAPWPAGTRGVELPADFSSIPGDWWNDDKPRTGWSLHLADGTTKPVSVTAPHIYRAFCSTRVGLVTDYTSAEPLPPPLPPPNPFPKDGLALSPDLPLSPIDTVPLTSPDVPKLLETLKPDLDKAETDTVTLIRSSVGWRHPEPTRQRNGRPVTLEAWYRAPLEDDPDWVQSYIEAVRSYPPQEHEQDCGLVTFFSGWVQQNRRDPSKNKSTISARVTYCDRKGVTYMLPFGRIRVDGKEHWVYQLSGFEEEWYVVARIEPRKLTFMAQVLGGFCGR